MKLCHLVVLPPPYQRPPGAEIPAMGFAATLKILVKANLLFELRDRTSGNPIGVCPVGIAPSRVRTHPYIAVPDAHHRPAGIGAKAPVLCMTLDPFYLRVRTRCVNPR